MNIFIRSYYIYITVLFKTTNNYIRRCYNKKFIVNNVASYIIVTAVYSCIVRFTEAQVLTKTIVTC